MARRWDAGSLCWQVGTARYVMVLVMGVLAVACDRDPSGGTSLPPPVQRDIALGEQLFNGNCARCHGRDGSGSNQGPPLVHKVYEPNHHADFAFHMAVNKGVKSHHWEFGDMPAVKGLGYEQVEHIVGYVRTLQHRAGIF